MQIDPPIPISSSPALAIDSFPTASITASSGLAAAPRQFRQAAGLPGAKTFVGAHGQRAWARFASNGSTTPM